MKEDFILVGLVSRSQYNGWVLTHTNFLQVGQVGLSILILLAIREGDGTHFWNVKLESFLKLLYVSNITSTLLYTLLTDPCSSI